MSEPLRWGILGTGNIAGKFASQINATRHGQLVATGSRTQESAERFMKEHGGTAHGSYEALIADPNIQAIYNSLPNSLHASWSIAALQAGKHVLCEKPLAASTAEVEAMFQAAALHERHLMEAFMYRHHPVVKEVLQQVHQGAIGDVKIIRSHFTYQRPDHTEDIRYQPELGGGGLLDIGCYCINFIRAIANGEPCSMHIQAHSHETGVDDYAVGTLTFPNDILAVFTCGMVLQSDRTTTIAGSEGYLQIDIPWFSNGRYRLVREDLDEQREAGQSEQLYALEAEHFAQVIRGDTAPLISRADSLANAHVLETLQQQLQASS